MRPFYGDPRLHDRLMVVIDDHLGHDLAARAEQAKIDVAAGGDTRVDLGHVEAALGTALTEAGAMQAVGADLERIVDAARETARQAGLRPAQVDALYFTGGSTGLRSLTDRLASAFPQARVARGDRFASVVTGLGLHAERRFDR